MERLTEIAHGQAFAKMCGKNCEHQFCCKDKDFSECANMNEIIDRLAAYEDTGLTPEEVAEALELLKAKRDGRCVVLPCKVGDTVYWMWTDSVGNCEAPIYEDRVYEICVTKNGVELSNSPYDGALGMVGIHPPRAIFLTLEAAEAALEKPRKSYGLPPTNLDIPMPPVKKPKEEKE